MCITLLYSLHITSLYIRENNDGYQRTKEMRLRNKHDRDKSWDNQDNIPPMMKEESKDDRLQGTMKYPTQEEIIAFNRKENKVHGRHSNWHQLRIYPTRWQKF